MPRYKAVIEYFGPFFSGFQRQVNRLSVQSAIERALLDLTHEVVTIYGAGRTDAGVHALHQVIHFDLKQEKLDHKLLDGLNYYLRFLFGTKWLLPISVRLVHRVSDDFHARFHAISRQYCYRILCSAAHPSLEYQRVWHIKKKINLDLIKHEATFFIGTHDFASFRASECQAHTPIRTLNSCKITENHPEIHIHFTAPSFLHNQVRIMVGTLYDIGRGRLPPGSISFLLETPSRIHSGQTAPPEGLYLTHVAYAS